MSIFKKPTFSMSEYKKHCKELNKINNNNNVNNFVNRKRKR